MKQTKILGLVLMVLVLTNCSPKGPEVEPTQEVATIEGVWHTLCIEDGSNSYIKSFQVENGVMTMAKLFYFNTRTCDQALLGATLMQSGSLTITGDSSSVAGGKEYEWKFNIITATPNDDATTTMFNNISFCGSNSWVKDQAGVVLGCNTPGMLDLTQVSFNTIHYGVFTIEAAATPDYLQFESKCAVAGYEEFCPTVGDRPTTLDGTTYFKQ